MKRLVAIIFLLGFAAFSITLKTELLRQKSPLAALKIGEPMPDLILPDTTGKPVKLSSIIAANKVVLVNFWASWCGPCRVEMPSFEALYKAQKNNGFAMVAIAEDDDRAKLDEYLKNKPVPFLVLVDSDGAVAKQLKVEALPTTVLIGHDGKVRRVYEGVKPYIQFAVQSELKEAVAK